MSDKPEVTAAAVTEPATAPTDSAKWQEVVGAFAKSIGKPYEDVTKNLVLAVGEANDEGLDTLADTDCCSNDMIMQAVGAGTPPAKLNKAIKVLRAALAPTAIEAPAKAAASTANVFILLPTPPTDESFMGALRVGGIAKVGETEVVAAQRVLLAEQLGVYNIAERVLDAMEARAKKLHEPVDDTFYELQKLITEKQYGEILHAMGISGRFMSARRKQELLDNLSGLWQLLYGFHKRLDAWNTTWQQGFNNPGMLFAMMASREGAALGGMPPLPALEPPDVKLIEDAAMNLIEELNKMFAGTGIPVAKALAHDTMRIKAVLLDKRLPAALGKGSREEMLKDLGIAVTADYERLEADLARYVLAIMKFAAGKVEPEIVYNYLSALWRCGANIAWQGLLEKAPKPAAGKKRDNSGDDGRPFRSYDES